MKLRKVDPNSIVVPEVRVTARFDPELWEQFQSSIKEIGAVAPIICCEVDPSQIKAAGMSEEEIKRYLQPNGEVLVLVDGLHRLVEVRNKGEAKVEVAVIPGDMVDVLTRNLFLDHMRGKTPVSEMVTVIEVLWKEYELDSEKIAAKTGLTRDYVEKLQKLTDLTPYCRQALDEGRISVGQAYEIVRIKDPVRQEMVEGQVELYHFKVLELREHVNNILEMLTPTSQEPTPAATPEPFLVECKFCHEKYDIHQIANPAICNDCAGALILINREAKRAEEVLAKPKTE